MSRDRLGFLRELARRAVEAAAELDAALQPSQDEPPAPRYTGPAVEPAVVLPAAAATRTATRHEVRALCRELGRPEWETAAANAARLSFRLTPAEGGAARLGDGLELPSGVEAPTLEGEPLPCILRLPLDAVPRSALPPAGTLLVFARAEPEPSARALLVAADAPAADASGLPVALSGELTLPPEIAETELDAYDLHDWLMLRERLAAAQGVELEELAADRHALHRLLGHPDTVGAELELEVELLARGVAAAEPDPADLEVARFDADWRLFVQVSADPSAGLGFEDEKRLYVWIREPDLAAARFESLRALVR